MGTFQLSPGMCVGQEVSSSSMLDIREVKESVVAFYTYSLGL